MSECPRDVTQEQEEAYYDHCVEVMEDRGIAECEFKLNAFNQALYLLLEDIKSMRIVSVESNASDYGEYDIAIGDDDLPINALGDWVENIIVSTKMIIERPGDGQQYVLGFKGEDKPNALCYDHYIDAGTIGKYIDEKLSKFEDAHQPYIELQIMKTPETVAGMFFRDAATSHNKFVLEYLLKKMNLNGDEILFDRETSRAQAVICWVVELLSKNKTEEDCVKTINQLEDITSKVESGEISINERGSAEESLSISMSM